MRCLDEERKTFGRWDACLIYTIEAPCCMSDASRRNNTERGSGLSRSVILTFKTMLASAASAWYDQVGILSLENEGRALRAFVERERRFRMVVPWHFRPQ